MMKISNNIYFLPLLLTFIGVTLDLLTTFIGIDFFGCFETRPLGGVPLVEYPVTIGFTLLLCWLVDFLSKNIKGDSLHFRAMAKISLYFLPILLFYVSFHNVLVICNVWK